MSARDERAKGLVKGDMTVCADSSEEEMDGPMGADQGLVTRCPRWVGPKVEIW